MTPVKRALVVTVAGTSTRFRESAQRDVLKCLYHEGKAEDSILYYFALFAGRFGFDAVRFVGGYQFEELKGMLQTPAFRQLTSNLDLACIFNPEFEAKGSSYSIHLGLRDILDDPIRGGFEEILLMEGDLVVDFETLEKVVAHRGDVLTTCRETITARTSVAVYKTMQGEMRFVYDTLHRSLAVPEPFQEIYNSGQVWKFADLNRLRRTMESLTEDDLKGTGLVILQKYFQGNPNPAVMTFNDWINCNRLEDYRQARALIRSQVAKWNR